MITTEQILNALRQVEDPDLKKDLVTLNMIDQVKIEGKNVSFRLILTTPACPLKNQIKQACIEAVHRFADPSAVVEVEVTSKVTTRRKETDAMLSQVKNIIAVGSGKGGVGKSTWL